MDSVFGCCKTFLFESCKLLTMICSLILLKLGARAEDRFQVVSRLGKGVAKVNLVKEKDDPTGTIKVLKKIEYSYLPVNVNNARREVSSK